MSSNLLHFLDRDRRGVSQICLILSCASGTTYTALAWDEQVEREGGRAARGCKNQVYSAGVAYARSHELWPTPGYSSKRGDAPASFSDLIMLRLFSTSLALSLSPTKHQHGMFLIFSTFFRS